jgi:biopolymer transport protein ExbD
MSEINVTPLVDVMLVLLVIFIITSPLMLSAIKLDLPKAQNHATAQTVQAIKISIDAKSRLFLADQALDLQDLSAQLLDLAAQAKARNSTPLPEVQLKADSHVPYGRVVEVMDAAQRAGLSRIGFVTESKPTPAKP